MTRGTLVARSLRYYWRTNLAVALGVGVAVSAMAGALVVGDSVRTSLRQLALARLGRAEHVITASNLFTEQLAERLVTDARFRAASPAAAPVLALEGVVAHERSGARAGTVHVYGVDDRFWSFHGVAGVTGPSGRDAFLSPALARELTASAGDALLLRVQKPSAIPAGVIQGRRNEPGRAVRLSVARVLERDQLGEFSPHLQQGSTRAVFLPLARLQRELDLPHRINVVLAGGRGGAEPVDALQDLIEKHADLEDLGLRTRPLSDSTLVVESDAGLLPEQVEKAAVAAALDVKVEPMPVLTYLATAIRVKDAQVPYSLVTALPESHLPAPSSPSAPGTRPIWLTRWAADDLAANIGDPVTLEYYLWSDEAGLTTASADFTLAGILPMQGLAIDADLTPTYPGLSTSADMADWDPPFPVDLKRIRRKDEEYWDRYRTAPKAFLRIADGQKLWTSRYGAISSLRIPRAAELHGRYRTALAARLPVQSSGFRVVPARENALAAAAGTTDFGEYFTYFSFFIVVSSLLLTLLFFRLGIEQRAREIGLLAALGYTPQSIRNGFLAEGLTVALLGALLGIAGAVGYAWSIMFALRTWWVDAVGTTELHVHLSAFPLVAGAAMAVAAGVVFITWSLRVLRRASARQLMGGSWTDNASFQSAWAGERFAFRALGGRRLLIGAALVLTAMLVLASLAGVLPPAAAFFGSGSLLLIAGLGTLGGWLRQTARHTFVRSRWPLTRLGLRNARYRPSRSVLSAALVAAATFLIVSVGAFRRGSEDVSDPRSGSGGYALIAESIAPLMHDPATETGREALGLAAELERIDVARFRLRPGDDASCLNLYRPQNPRLLGATGLFIAAGRFGFSDSLAQTSEEEANPWLLLERRFDDGAIPVVGDATSLAYVFHLRVGEDFVMQGADGRPLRLRIVGALRDSVLQSELIMSDTHFTRLFPRLEGFRVFLIDTEPARMEAVATALEQQLQDFGMDVQSTAERLASYHRVENTFLTTFQALGAIGLVLGTLGLGTVLLRNVLERQRELALLQATGYRRRHLVWMVFAESLFVLGVGLALGVVCAAVAIAPAYLDRSQPFPLLATIGLLLAVVAAGSLSTIAATRAVAKMPLLESLKNE